MAFGINHGVLNDEFDRDWADSTKACPVRSLAHSRHYRTVMLSHLICQQTYDYTTTLGQWLDGA
jgi:hypothetical protein